MQADISPIFCMAFTIVFFIDIINILLKRKWEMVFFQQPMRQSISPYWAMDLTRFLAKVFFIICLPPKLRVKSLYFVAWERLSFIQAWGYYSIAFVLS